MGGQCARAVLAGALMSVAAVGVVPAASAATVHPTTQSGVLVVELSHAETVTAAQLGVGHVINAALGNDGWGVVLARGSRYHDGRYYRPEKGGYWNDVTGQQVIAEAGSHQDGRVVLAIYADPDASSYGHPLWVQQIW